MTKDKRTLLVLVLTGWVCLIPVVRRTVVRGLYLLAVGHLSQFHDYLNSLGPWAPLVSISLMISQAVAVPLPVTVLMVANGVVFGVWGGMLVSFVGGFAGSVVAYGLGHHFGRGVAEGIVPRAALDAADRVMKRRGGWAVVLGRWVPGIPCDPLSYAAGITRMPLVPFLVLTVVGLIPANLVTAYLGAEATTDVKTSYWLLGIAGVAALWGAWTLFKRHRKRAEMRKADAA